MEFHRDKGSKDLSGWNGPAEVVDNSHPERGHITLRFRNYPFECRWQDVRPHIDFLVFLAHQASATGTQIACWQQLKQAVDQIRFGSYVTVGLRLNSRNYWNRSAETTQWQSTLDTAISFAISSLHLSHVTTLRLMKGCAVAPFASRASPSNNALVDPWKSDPIHNKTRKR